MSACGGGGGGRGGRREWLVFGGSGKIERGWIDEGWENDWTFYVLVFSTGIYIWGWIWGSCNWLQTNGFN